MGHSFTHVGAACPSRVLKSPLLLSKALPAPSWDIHLFSALRFVALTSFLDVTHADAWCGMFLCPSSAPSLVGWVLCTGRQSSPEYAVKEIMRASAYNSCGCPKNVSIPEVAQPRPSIAHHCGSSRLRLAEP